MDGIKEINLEENPERKRPLGRHRRTGEVNVKMDLKK
jgi:hypothetical protein